MANIKFNPMQVDGDGQVALDSASLSASELDAGSVGTSEITDGSISLADLDSGIAPSHIAVYGAKYTTTGGGAAEAITVTGAAATDLAQVTLVDEGTNTVSVLKAVLTTNTLTVTFSGDPGNDAIIDYVILRAAS